MLAQLHSRHEVGMLKRVSKIKRQQIEEAEASLEGAHRSKSVVQARPDFFTGNLQAFTSPSETAQIADLDRAHNAELTSAALSLGASIAYAFPDVAWV